MTFRMERRKAQVSEKVNIFHNQFDFVSGVVENFNFMLTFVIVELMIGEPIGDSYDYSSSTSGASSCIVIFISTASYFSLARLLN